MVRALPRKTKRSRVAAEILEGLTALQNAVRVGIPLEQTFTVKTVKLVVKPQRLAPKDIRMLRGRLSSSQSVFAAVLGVSPDAVQSWEQGRRPPSESALRMMHLFRDAPELFARQIQLKTV